jgi:hypothetical protein
MDFHPNGLYRLSTVCAYLCGQYDLPDLQEHLQTLMDLLPKGVATDLGSLQEELEAKGGAKWTARCNSSTF